MISLGEFTILELLRLQRVTTDDLDRIREIFNQIDVGETGNIDKPMLVKSNLYRGYGSFDEVELLKVPIILSQ
jgi:Ca2+-binding EF-hand superfamily protein